MNTPLSLLGSSFLYPVRKHTMLNRIQTCETSLVSCRSNFCMVFCQFVGKNIDYVYKLQHVQRMSTILLVIEIQLTNISPCQALIASCVPLFRFDEASMARIFSCLIRCFSINDLKSLFVNFVPLSVLKRLTSAIGAQSTKNFSVACMTSHF